MRRRLAIAILVVLAGTGVALAQRRGYGRELRYARLEDFDGSFQFCRVVFRQGAGDGGNWSVDFPQADQNLSIRLSELTKMSVGMDPDETPKHLLVNLSSPELFHCPFIMMTEVGSIYLDPNEAKGLREYLTKGGFLWADDFWGNYAWQVFENEMRKVFPSGTHPIVDIPIDHPMFHSLMPLERVPQIASIGFWGGPGGPTSERGAESAIVHARGILDERGRVMVFITHNTDIGDSFEREAESRQYFLQFSVQGYALGINVLLYAFSH